MISVTDRNRPSVRAGTAAINALLLGTLVLTGLYPLYWTVKGAISLTQQLLREPLRPWPDPVQIENLALAWNQLDIGRYLLNTVVLVAGSWVIQIGVCTLAAYALAILRPWWGKYVYGAILATLFVPGTVTLISLYLTVRSMPVTGWNLLNTPWAIWGPAAVSAFSIVILKRFFDDIPREIIEAAELDGASPFAVFRMVVLPVSVPILAVTSLMSIMWSWKEFLWPLVVLTEPSAQPLSVALPRLASQADQSLLIAGMLIALVPPVLLFVIFQRYITRGLGYTGVKG
ncbi:carbohydrate ABC transporter permease [Microbacterium testaceum]|uniref:carbohydrate ABC transporter permease n=1 Tax=Microbacterium testaceum TaxID=2033 RepID=UPI001F4CA451|nr:carbohydrate ABC transporter permease [Microbacterium testaceum]